MIILGHGINNRQFQQNLPDCIVLRISNKLSVSVSLVLLWTAEVHCYELPTSLLLFMLNGTKVSIKFDEKGNLVDHNLFFITNLHEIIKFMGNVNIEWACFMLCQEINLGQ